MLQVCPLNEYSEADCPLESQGLWYGEWQTVHWVFTYVFVIMQGLHGPLIFGFIAADDEVRAIFENTKI